MASGNGPDITVDGLTQDTIMTLTVSVTGGELDNCEVLQNVEVNYVPGPTGVVFSGAICPDEEFDLVALNFAMEGTSQNDYTYEWTNANDDTLGTSSVYQATAEGIYEVVVTMVAPCTWSTTSVFDLEEDICDLTIPNVISPNGSGQWDNMNDAFLVSGLDSDRYDGSTIRIYNRWGQLMYSSNDFGKSAGWRPEPEEATEGTYFYILGIARTNSTLIINDINGEMVDDGEGYKYINGTFTLVRD